MKSMGDKVYDLEPRTFAFAKDCRFLMKRLPKTIETIEDGKQLIRSSGSVGANYIEANESLSKKDFYYRIKICRKEAKASGFFGINSCATKPLYPVSTIACIIAG